MSIFVTRGASLTISGISINLETGEMSSPTVTIGYDVFPHWLSIAIKAAREARAYASELDPIWDGSGNPKATELLEREIAASMTAIVAAAAALDGFYGSAMSRVSENDVVPQATKRRSRERRIISFLEQKFVLQKDTLGGLAKPMKEIFDFRHAVLHSHGKPEEPGLHPRYDVAMAKKIVIFRAENAVTATDMALKAISYLICLPKQRHKNLVEHCHRSRSWVHPLLADWMRDREPTEFPLEMLTYGPTGTTFKNRAVPKHCRI